MHNLLQALSEGGYKKFAEQHAKNLIGGLKNIFTDAGLICRAEKTKNGFKIVISEGEAQSGKVIKKTKKKVINVKDGYGKNVNQQNVKIIYEEKKHKWRQFVSHWAHGIALEERGTNMHMEAVKMIYNFLVNELLDPIRPRYTEEITPIEDALEDVYNEFEPPWKKYKIKKFLIC